jgi:D-aminopeptidase
MVWLSSTSVNKSAVVMNQSSQRASRFSLGQLEPGPLNSITDVAGVRVGHTTVIHDQPMVARTGVTIIQPHLGEMTQSNVFAGFHRYNGFGEVTGVQWLAESGVLTSPVALAPTFSLGLVRDTILQDTTLRGPKGRFQIPVVGETNDFFLNDAPHWPLKQEHVLDALRGASVGPVEEGCVGAGTGTIAYLFKAGIGTASKKVQTQVGEYTVGVLVQSNHGRREDLLVDGVPVGLHVGGDLVGYPELNPNDPYLDLPPSMRRSEAYKEDGSIVIVVATDAPLLPNQCTRLAQRACIGLGRAGGIGNNGSGDFAICFSTANQFPAQPDRSKVLSGTHWLANEEMSPLFRATIEATESAIVNSLVAANTMVGRHGNKAHALPLELVISVMKAHGRDPTLTL